MARQCDNSSCDKSSCEGCASAQKPDFSAEMNKYSDIKHVIGVVSGKGGVGKSFVTASLANAFAGMGFKTGILDGDITGPSIPRMYGLKERAAMSDKGLEPAVTENGLKVISINLLLPDEEEPVVWRGPIVANMVKQFWTEVVWGDLDYLFVDMPPGTGDVPLTVFQSLPVEGVVIVSSPQDLVKMIVSKAYKMAQMMDIPVIGIIENYSYVECPDCGKKISIFGESHIKEVAESMGLPLLGTIPVRTEYADAADEGGFGKISNPYIDDAAEAVRRF